MDQRRYKARELYKTLAHRAGGIRKRYKLLPTEAAWCALWLAGAEEQRIPALADEMDRLRRQREEAKWAKT